MHLDLRRGHWPLHMISIAAAISVVVLELAVTTVGRHEASHAERTRTVAVTMAGDARPASKSQQLTGIARASARASDRDDPDSL